MAAEYRCRECRHDPVGETVSHGDACLAPDDHEGRPCPGRYERVSPCPVCGEPVSTADVLLYAGRDKLDDGQHVRTCGALACRRDHLTTGEAARVR